MTTHKTDPREAKLPAWAQTLLKDERHRTDAAEAALAAHKATAKPSRIWFGEYDNPVYVPTQHGHRRVHFNLGIAGVFEHREDVQVSIQPDGVLEIMGGNTLAITPQSSNVIRIRLTDKM